MSVYGTIRAMIREHRGGVKTFVDRLDRAALPYLSYSKIDCVESCPYRYLLAYVHRVKLDPEPGYFIKGRIFHRGAARYYRARARGVRLSPSQLKRSADCLRGTHDHAHLCNAFDMLVSADPEDLEVVAVEELFALELGRKLPPLVGVIDLVGRRGNTFHVIDHKTGRDFYPQDELQLALYARYVRQRYGAGRVRAWYHQYRWVNNLSRIRKPALECTETRPPRRAGIFRSSPADRLRRAWETIRQIEQTGQAQPSTHCLLCPYADQCDRYTPYRWWYGG